MTLLYKFTNLFAVKNHHCRYMYFYLNFWTEIIGMFWVIVSICGLMSINTENNVYLIKTFQVLSKN